MKRSHYERLSGMDVGREEQDRPTRRQRFDCSASFDNSTSELSQIEGVSAHHTENEDGAVSTEIDW